MINYVADTTIVSALSPLGGRLSDQQKAWALENERFWCLPTIVIMEIEQGVHKLARLGSTRKIVLVSAWMNRLLRNFSDRIVDLDLASARRAGAISDDLIAKGRHPGLADVLIAAIADVRGMTVLTRNVRHFEATGVAALDPFSLSAGK
jgi:predicted nucleic acid-binding protein